jgi:hypothetical protein
MCMKAEPASAPGLGAGHGLLLMAVAPAAPAAPANPGNNKVAAAAVTNAALRICW